MASQVTAKDTFLKAYRRVCKARVKAVDLEHADECWRVLQGERPWLFDETATRLNATAEYFPSPREWADAYRQVAREHDARRTQAERQVLPADPDERTFECRVCEDSGWQPFDCLPGQLCSSCRALGHLHDHRYVRQCECRATNQTWRAANLSGTGGAA